MRRSFVRALPLIFMWVLLTGMGKAPGPEVPMPDVDFRATVRDDQDISTKINHLSWEGNTYFIGNMGKGVVTVPFEKVKKVVSVGSATEGKLDFQITLKAGEVVAVSFDEDSKLTGMTGFGTYRILAKNIKEIAFE